MPRTVAVFDWDGVVIDSSVAHERSWEALAKEENLPLPADHFKRGFGKRNELTPLGREVVVRARRIVLEASELRRSAERMQGGGGSIRVGLGSGPGALLTTPLLCHAAEQHPDLRVSITRGPTELQLLQLRARQLDALVVDARRVAPAPDL